MPERRVVAVFESGEKLKNAARLAREKNLRIFDCYTPFPVHGLEEIVGIRSSRISWFMFCVGMSGALGILAFMFWTTAVDWPINVGGKPWNSLPAFIPITFEVGVLSSGVSTFLFLLFLCGLFPGKKAKLPDPDVTSHAFALVLEEPQNLLSIAEAEKLFKPLGAVRIFEWREKA